LRSFLGSIKIGSDEFNVNLDVEPEVGSADSGNLIILVIFWGNPESAVGNYSPSLHTQKLGCFRPPPSHNIRHRRTSKAR
jgi:hypothetical protein